MLFRPVDLTEFVKARTERDEYLDRVSRGLQAVKAAAEKLQQAKIATPDSVPELSMEELAKTSTVNDGEGLAANLLTDLGHVERLRKEVDDGQATVGGKLLVISMIEQLNAQRMRFARKITLRIAGVVLLIIALRQCAK